MSLWKWKRTWFGWRWAWTYTGVYGLTYYDWHDTPPLWMCNPKNWKVD